MALSAKEKKAFKELQDRAEVAESENKNVQSVNDELAADNASLTDAAARAEIDAVDDDNVSAAQAEIDKNDAVSAAREEMRAEYEAKLAIAGGTRADKSISPKAPTTFDKNHPFDVCQGGGAHYAQNGWYYDNKGKPVDPVNKPSE